MTRKGYRGPIILALAIALFFLLSTTGVAATGDLFESGTVYCATTYSGHSNYHEWPRTADSNILDIVVVQLPSGQAVGNDGNYRMPVTAPEAGTVEQVTVAPGGGWGNSIIWTSSDGSEQIHIAHLDEVGATGRVGAGDIIGYEGHTGHCVPSDFNHLHVSRRVEGEMLPVVLSGNEISPNSHRLGRSQQTRHTATGPATTTTTRPATTTTLASPPPITQAGASSKAEAASSPSATAVTGLLQEQLAEQLIGAFASAPYHEAVRTRMMAMLADGSLARHPGMLLDPVLPSVGS